MPPYYNYPGIRYNGGIQSLPQVSLTSSTTLYDTASRTLLSQTFVNPSAVNHITSAKYTFPLYESCAIVSFRCRIGIRVIEGVIKEKQDASATYQAAVEQQEPASLLEQQTADVFTTSLGNIPPRETVRVEIEYIMELKHDAEVDGLRFTIPTSIAPRYGELPSELGPDAISTPVRENGINISVQVSMSSNITSIQSPSHPISVHLGGHTQNTADDAFNPRNALATLGQISAELGKDFILLIKCVSLSLPSALLETHPTIPNSKALMLTLVPKFSLPESSKPEVVFIVDRSGSMSSRIAPLKSSLSVFLRSLPLDINFNICSFGSSHSFLWPQSKPYSSQSFAEAQQHCDSMDANMGGTEILPAVKSTVAKRLRDLNLEIMVLTDGEVWNSETLLEYVEKETTKGDVRLFSLGIGQDVSHALIDGLARVGRGFSQVVSDEREGMESKVARMLRGALSAHVLNYRVEWEGKPNEEEAPGVPGQVQAQTHRPLSITRAVRRISLFDTQANTDSPVSFSEPTLPEFIVPSVLQAPYKLQPLFPFSRSTAYAILSSDVCRPPSQVWLRGTTPDGDELELEIPVRNVPEEGQTIHQLAARKILQELKDRTGYLHSGKYGVSRERQPAAFGESVKKEGVRVGLKYGVASEWTSFVAVVRNEEDMVERETRAGNQSLGSGLDDDDDDDEMYEFVDGDGDDDNGGSGGAGSGLGLGDAHTGIGAPGGSATRLSAARRPAPQPIADAALPVMMMMAPPPPAVPYPTKSSSSSFSKSKRSKYPSKAAFFSSSSGKPSATDNYASLLSDPISFPGAAMRSPAPPSPLSVDSDLTAPNPYSQSLTMESSAPQNSPSSAFPTSLFGSDESTVRPEKMKWGGFGSASSLSSRFSRERSKIGSEDMFAASSPTLPKLHDSKWLSKRNKSSNSNISIAYSPPSAPPAERLVSETEAQPLSLRTKALIDLQTFEGCFVFNQTLAASLGVSITDLEAKLSRFMPSDMELSQERRRSVWATVLAIRLFETQLVGERNVWQLVVDKAKAWLQESGIVNDTDVQELEMLAKEVLGI